MDTRGLIIGETWFTLSKTDRGLERVEQIRYSNFKIKKITFVGDSDGLGIECISNENAYCYIFLRPNDIYSSVIDYILRTNDEDENKKIILNWIEEYLNADMIKTYTERGETEFVMLLLRMMKERNIECNSMEGVRL